MVIVLFDTEMEKFLKYVRFDRKTLRNFCFGSSWLFFYLFFLLSASIVATCIAVHFALRRAL